MNEHAIISSSYWGLLQQVLCFLEEGCNSKGAHDSFCIVSGLGLHIFGNKAPGLSQAQQNLRIPLRGDTTDHKSHQSEDSARCCLRNGF